MRQRTLKKVVLSILVTSLMTSMFAACGNSNSSSGNISSTSGVSKVTQEAAAPAIPLYTQRPDTKGKSSEEILKGDIIYSVGASCNS